MNPIDPNTDLPDMALVYRAFESLAKDYKGSRKALSLKLGKSANTLSNELNSSMPGHKLGLADAIALMHLAKNYSPLQAIAATLNHTITHLGEFSSTGDVELLSAYADWHREIGKVAREVSLTLSDGSIQRSDYHRILQEGIGQVQAFFEFLARLEALVDD